LAKPLFFPHKPALEILVMPSSSILRRPINEGGHMMVPPLSGNLCLCCSLWLCWLVMITSAYTYDDDHRHDA
jgi:hypothetical protein